MPAFHSSRTAHLDKTVGFYPSLIHQIMSGKFGTVLTILAILITISASTPRTFWQIKIDPALLQSEEDNNLEALILLEKQADLKYASNLSTKLEKTWYVYEQLTQLAQKTQAPLIQWLRSQNIPYRQYWVVNMIWVQTDRAQLEKIARRVDVAYLYANPHTKLQPGLPNGNQPDSSNAPQAGTGVEWNIQKVNAPQVWSAGFTGQGVVIAGQDTGYEWEHPALKPHYRGWNGSSVDHNYSWHDAIHADDSHTPPGNPCGFDVLEPCDDHYHGTHTMGIMVGDDGGANQIGMAPGAKWIGCRNMEEGWGTPATYAECYQWFIAPTDLNGENPRPDLAPDVINNSWACPASEGCTDPLILKMVVENVRAAGIVTVHAAGNSGPSCETINTPAAIYDASFTVGNTTSNDQIAASSSRGPVTVDDSNRLKPDISAPGTDIRSSIPGDSYSSLSGTSMAAPHVAGLVALLLSAQPALRGDVDQIETVITQNAVPLTTNQTCGGVPGTEVPNNTFGWGRIDAWNSVQNLPHFLLLDKKPSAYLISPGDTLTYTILISHLHPFSPTYQVVLSDIIPTNSNFISATLPFSQTGNLIEWHWTSLNNSQEAQVELVIEIPHDVTNGVVTNQFYAVKSNEVEITWGIPVTSFTGWYFMIFPYIFAGQ